MSKHMINVPYLEDIDITPGGTLKPYVCKGKPVVVMIQGNFCPHCNNAKPAFTEFAESSHSCSVVTIQTDGSPSEKGAVELLSKVNSSRGVPAYLGFDKNGKFVKMHEGGRDVASLKNFAASL